MDIKYVGYQYIDKNSRELYELSRYLFENPELAFQEHKAHDYLCSFLESKGFKVERKFLLETGFRAVYENAPQPHVVILVEMDALPNLGHACGHNLIAECSVAAGLGVAEIMKRCHIKGKLTLLGTPAEETGGGKITYVTEGFFEDVTAALMSHPNNETFIHRPSLAVSEFLVNYTGKESHAAVAPWEGVNALDAVVIAYQSVSVLRQQVHPDCRILGVITNGGVVPNVIPNFAQMHFEVRALTKRLLNELLPRVMNCFEAAAKATGCELKVSKVSLDYDNIRSNRCLSELYKCNAEDLSIELEGDNGVSSGSSDVGNVSHACPTIQPEFYIGTTSAPHTEEFAIAAGGFDAQKYVLTQAKALTGTLTDILLDKRGDIVDRLKNDFLDDIKDD